MTWHRALRYAARRVQRSNPLRQSHQVRSSAWTAFRTAGVFSLASGLIRLGPLEDTPSPSASPSPAFPELRDLASPKGLGLISASDARGEDGCEGGRRVYSAYSGSADGPSSGALGAVWARVQQVSRHVERGFAERWATTEGRLILQVMGVNFAVLALWKVLPASFMVRHFASSLEAMRRGRVWVTLTSNFSHQSFFHLACNMYLLDAFGRDVVTILSPERFAVLYAAGGIASVLGSLASRRLMRNNVLSLGASGSVMATMFMFSNLFPDRKLYVLGMWEIKARDALVLWAMFDAAGLLGSFGKIDFAAHLSGGIFSLAYYKLIREDLAREYATRQRGSWKWAGA